MQLRERMRAQHTLLCALDVLASAFGFKIMTKASFLKLEQSGAWAAHGTLIHA